MTIVTNPFTGQPMMADESVDFTSELVQIDDLYAKAMAAVANVLGDSGNLVGDLDMYDMTDEPTVEEWNRELTLQERERDYHEERRRIDLWIDDALPF